GAVSRIGAGVRPGVLELGQRRHQGLRYVLAPVGDETVLDRAHPAATRVAVDATAAANDWSLATSLRPGAASTPLATSTAKGCTAAIASATLAGFRPPDRISGTRRPWARASSQANVSPVPPGIPDTWLSSRWESVWNEP